MTFRWGEALKGGVQGRGRGGEAGDGKRAQRRDPLVGRNETRGSAEGVASGWAGLMALLGL